MAKQVYIIKEIKVNLASGTDGAVLHTYEQTREQIKQFWEFDKLPAKIEDIEKALNKKFSNGCRYTVAKANYMVF